MSNDRAECGCEGHYENFDDCKYPAALATIAELRKALKEVSDERDVLVRRVAELESRTSFSASVISAQPALDILSRNDV
jgi:cell division protein FtsB